MIQTVSKVLMGHLYGVPPFYTLAKATETIHSSRTLHNAILNSGETVFRDISR